MLNRIKSMIDVNSFKNKKSDGKQIIYFEYTIEPEEKNCLDKELVFRFNKMSETIWRVELVTTHKDVKEIEAPMRLISEVYQLPNNSVPLTVVCGIGLAAIKQTLEEEIHYYSGVQFTIADIINNIANQTNN